MWVLNADIKHPITWVLCLTTALSLAHLCLCFCLSLSHTYKHTPLLPVLLSLSLLAVWLTVLHLDTCSLFPFQPWRETFFLWLLAAWLFPLCLFSALVPLGLQHTNGDVLYLDKAWMKYLCPVTSLSNEVQSSFNANLSASMNSELSMD